MSSLPSLPLPQDYGWELNDNEWSPVMSKLPPAPEASIHLIKCGCTKTRCSTNHCQCRKAGLVCTDLCKFSESGDTCDNNADSLEHDDDDVLMSYSEDEDEDDI